MRWWISGINADDARTDALAEFADERQGFTRAQFYNDRSFDRREPGIQSCLLSLCAQSNPVIVPVHHEIGTCNGSAVRADRQVIDQLACGFVDNRLKCFRRPQGIAADLGALHNVDTAVAFCNQVLWKPGPLKLTVGIAGENRCATRHVVRPAAKGLKTGVGRSVPIKLESLAIEPSAERRRSG